MFNSNNENCTVFKFNFNNNNNSDNDNDDEQDITILEENKEQIWNENDLKIKTNEIDLIDKNINKMSFASIKIINNNDNRREMELYYRILDEDKLLSNVKEDLIRETIKKKSDLSPSIYEGGFRLWECAIDLINHIFKMSYNFDNKYVLDLGCGHGLPGILALKNGAKQVIFQDLNDDVINNITMNNVLKNYKYNQEKIRFLSGDWRDPKLMKKIGYKKMNFILSSDTLYSSASIPNIVNILKQLLSSDGIALIAAKRFYFGVGGGILEFINQLGEDFIANSVHIFEDGNSNIREILKVVRRHK